MVVKTLFKVTNGSVSPSALRLSKRNPKNLLHPGAFQEELRDLRGSHWAHKVA